jgi:N-formylglutamate amidohydrolase
MQSHVLKVHGPNAAGAPATVLVLDSPHSGFQMPADFGAALSVAELRDGEDCFIDELWAPAAERGIPLLAAQFPRTYLDANRHAADIDPDLLDAPWPGEIVASGKAAIGKALVWRTMDADKLIYQRRLTVAEVQARIAHYHQPYHSTLRALLDAAHARFGVVYHINCHSMGANTSVSMEGVDGLPRADMVLGDRDGSTCAPEFTAFVRQMLAGFGYDVRVNDPFKGVELVRAFSHPPSGRHSLQLEINKRLYMHNDRIEKHAGFERLQGQLMQLLDGIQRQFTPSAAQEASHG